MKSCFPRIISLLFLLFHAATGQAQQSSSRTGQGVPVIAFEEDFPLDDSLSVEIFSDYTVSILEKKMKPFCSQPASDACWVKTEVRKKISPQNYKKIVNFIPTGEFEKWPRETDQPPGTASIYLSIPPDVSGGGKNRWIQLDASRLNEYPTLKSFQKMIHDLIKN